MKLTILELQAVIENLEKDITPLEIEIRELEIELRENWWDFIEPENVWIQMEKRRKYLLALKSALKKFKEMELGVQSN